MFQSLRIAKHESSKANRKWVEVSSVFAWRSAKQQAQDSQRQSRTKIMPNLLSLHPRAGLGIEFTGLISDCVGDSDVRVRTSVKITYMRASYRHSLLRCIKIPGIAKAK